MIKLKSLPFFVLNTIDDIYTLLVEKYKKFIADALFISVKRYPAQESKIYSFQNMLQENGLLRALREQGHPLDEYLLDGESFLWDNR